MSVKPIQVVCQLWPDHDPAFARRSYNTWWGKCVKCGSKVIVTKRTHIQMKTEDVALICVQCHELG